MDHKIQIVLGVLAIGIGLVLAFVQVNARKSGKKPQQNSVLPLYRFKWYRLALAIVSLVVGVLIMVDAMGAGSV